MAHCPSQDYDHHFAELEAQEERMDYVTEEDVRKALAPVIDWFQSDNDHPRPILDILKDVAEELDRDRRDNLKFRRALREVRGLI